MAKNHLFHKWGHFKRKKNRDINSVIQAMIFLKKQYAWMKRVLLMCIDNLLILQRLLIVFGSDFITCRSV